MYSSQHKKQRWNWPQCWRTWAPSGLSHGEVSCFVSFVSRVPKAAACPHTIKPVPLRFPSIAHQPQGKALPEALTPKQPKLSQHLAMHHSSSVTLTSSGWKNAVSQANWVPLLDRNANGRGVKRQQELFCSYTSGLIERQELAQELRFPHIHAWTCMGPSEPSIQQNLLWNYGGNCSVAPFAPLTRMLLLS